MRKPILTYYYFYNRWVLYSLRLRDLVFPSPKSQVGGQGLRTPCTVLKVHHLAPDLFLSLTWTKSPTMTTVPAASWTVTNTKAQTEGAASETTLSEEERRVAVRRNSRKENWGEWKCKTLRRARFWRWEIMEPIQFISD